MKLWSKSKAGLVFLVLSFLVLILLANSRYYPPSQHSREAVLKTDLRTMRDAIDNYTLDKKKAPSSLQDLVDASYLRSIPVDPITHKADWVPDFGIPVLGDPVLTPGLKAQGLIDVHSNSSQIAADRSQYKTW